MLPSLHPPKAPPPKATTPSMLLSPSACEEYLSTHTPTEIAHRLHLDANLYKSSRLPTLLAFHAPTKGRPMDLIARGLYHLRMQTALFTPQPIVNTYYLGIIQSIKTYLSQFKPGGPTPATDGNLPAPETRHIPTTTEFETALKVLEYLRRVPATRVTHETPLSDIRIAIETHIALDPAERAAYRSIPGLDSKREKKKNGGGGGGGGGGRDIKRCYICSYEITTPHMYYPSLCVPCGSFNLQESALSLPENLSLGGKTALVTGGRVNLGFHIALRLLRCGASVVVSSRYPLDAEARYRGEPDFGSWRGRIAVVGADFRTARDAFALAGAVRRVLGGWAEEGEGRLDVLVNNAAQTLTDSVEKERGAVEVERKLLEGGSVGELQVGGGYRAMIRVGESENRMLMGFVDKGNVVEEEAEGAVAEDSVIKDVAVRQESSWTQSLEEIPYEDIITAQSVNAFVPLILIRQLLPLMGTTRSTEKTEAKEQLQDDERRSALPKPAGYIINISSREGLSEIHPYHKMKNGHHVHTNMSKAALNMITETEAAPAWRDRRVALNSVDPGFMSAADGGECPIGWEDGAARALWCVAKGEAEGVCVWGRFLKHFGGVGAVVRPV